jgi:hypothetical protein
MAVGTLQHAWTNSWPWAAAACMGVKAAPCSVKKYDPPNPCVVAVLTLALGPPRVRGSWWHPVWLASTRVYKLLACFSRSSSMLGWWLNLPCIHPQQPARCLSTPYLTNRRLYFTGDGRVTTTRPKARNRLGSQQLSGRRTHRGPERSRCSL